MTAFAGFECAALLGEEALELGAGRDNKYNRSVYSVNGKYNRIVVIRLVAGRRDTDASGGISVRTPLNYRCVAGAWCVLRQAQNGGGRRIALSVIDGRSEGSESSRNKS
jgi:hypothetical protein